MLRDRDGLSDAQAEEVIAAARRMSSPEVLDVKNAKAKSLKDGTCTDLKQAKSTKESIQVLEAKRAQEAAEEQLEGARLLADLTPSTRVAVRSALLKYRQSLESVEPDWSVASPAIVARYKSKHCGEGAH